MNEGCAGSGPGDRTRPPAVATPLATRQAVEARVAELEALFARIAATRMAGIPILHPGLRVQAVGFEADGDAAAVGVLVTPWFMNLVWLPLVPGDDALPVGATRDRRVGRETFPFLGAHEAGFGAYESCSLFSPMADFANHDAAIATARAVLDELRRPEPPAPVSSRRALLFGRRGEELPQGAR